MNLNHSAMSSLLEVIELTKRFRRASVGERRRRPLPEPIALPCRVLLDEADALGLGLDDVIDALRRHAARSNNSN